MTHHDMPEIPEGMALTPRGKPPEGERIPSEESWTTTRAKAAKDGPAMGTVEEWKKLIDKLPPALVSIDVRRKVLEKVCGTGQVDKALEGSVIPFNYTVANDTPWWWPDQLARANYHEAPSKWLWLGKYELQPWWFRRWFSA